jgi:hypothetical protein
MRNVNTIPPTVHNVARSIFSPVRFIVQAIIRRLIFEAGSLAEQLMRGDLRQLGAQALGVIVDRRIKIELSFLFDF